MFRKAAIQDLILDVNDVSVGSLFCCYCIDIHGAQMMNPINFGIPKSPVVTPADLHFETFMPKCSQMSKFSVSDQNFNLYFGL